MRQKRFSGFSDRLAEVITELWLRAGDDVLEHVAEFLRGTGKFTLADFDEIDRIAEQSMRTAFGTNLNPIVQQASIAAYGKGLNEIRAGLSKSFSLVDQRAVSFIHDHHMYWSLNHYSSHTTERIKRLADQAISSGLSRRDAGKFFQNTIGQELKRDASYWELTADAITTRARSFSNISAFEEVGVERYEWDSVIDHRTSDICRYLDGKVFEVARAAEVRDAMIDAETPEDAKEIMPWAKPADVVDKPINELQSSGIVAPPAHGRCRARLVIA